MKAEELHRIDTRVRGSRKLQLRIGVIQGSSWSHKKMNYIHDRDARRCRR